MKRGRTVAVARLLLPSAAVVQRYGDATLRTVLARADALDRATPGRSAALRRAFETTPRQALASAAVRRQHQHRDAGKALWVAADPVQVQADMTRLRLMAVGGFALAPDEIESLQRSLRPLCGDLGFELSAGNTDHWYLRALDSNDVPLEGDPQELLGADLAEHLPASAKWRRLLNETQILLHQHPLNQRRVAQGRPALNSLWFWGGGVLPDQVRSRFRTVTGDDVLLLAWAAQAGALTGNAREETSASTDELLECWSPQRLQALQQHELPALLRQLARGRVRTLEVEFLSGERFAYRHWHRWRFWRRAAEGAAA